MTIPERNCKRLGCGAPGATRVEWKTQSGVLIATYLCPSCLANSERGEKAGALGAVEIERPANIADVISLAERRPVGQRDTKPGSKPDKEPA